MKIVDANVLLYCVNSDARQHEAASSWLDSALNNQEPVGFCWLVLVAFLRISTHPSVFSRPLSHAESADRVDEWLAQPSAVILEPTVRHASLLRGLLQHLGTAGNLVNDAHIAALAVEHGAEIASFDNDFERFAGVRRYQPAVS